MVAELIDKYVWLIQTLTDAGERGLTLDRIAGKWSSRYGGDYSRRTFNNHREAIADVFGIEIACRRSDNSYYIAYGLDAIDSDHTRRWMVDTFTVGNLLSLKKERLSGRVSVEDIPSGLRFLTPVMAAMLSNRELEIHYVKYTSQEGETLHVAPYAVKESDRRWYIVGLCRERGAIRVYGMDRITSLKETEEEFRMPEGFDVDELFAESYGVYLASPDEVCTIVFECSGTQARYLRDLPLHASQKEMGAVGDKVRFSIRAGVNKSLVMEFCKHAGDIEVISPVSVRDRMRNEFLKAYNLYKQ